MKRLEKGQDFLDGNISLHSNEENLIVVLRSATEITPEKTDWLVHDWLAKKSLNLIAGIAGTGKTTLSLEIVSLVTNGEYFPDGTKVQMGNVVIWTGEDGIADTIIPRLKAMGADLTKVYVVDGVTTLNKNRVFDPSIDIPALEKAIKKIGNVALIVVDPIVAVVNGDSHKNAEVRNDLTPITDLARALNVAVIGITHFSKGSEGKNPLERVTGSLAFTAVARVVLVASKITHENGEECRIFVRVKNNLGPDSGGFEYSIEQVEIDGGITASKIKWGNAIEGSARELLNDAESNDKGTAIEDCMKFLSDLLKDGAMFSNEVFQDCEANGYSKATVNRAKEKLGIKPTKAKGTAYGSWEWTLPKELKMLKMLNKFNQSKTDHIEGEI